MATGNYIQDKGYDVAAAITKFTAVKFTGTDETVTPVTAEGDNVAGIAQVGVTAGEILRGKGCNVRRMGASEMEALATFVSGDLVAIDAAGKAVASNSGARVIGTCDEGGSSGDRIRVTLSLPGYIAA